MCVVCQYVGWGSCSERYRTLGFLGVLSLIVLILVVAFSRRAPSGPAESEAPIGYGEDGLFYGVYYGQLAMKYAKLSPVCKVPFKRDWKAVCKWVAMAIIVGLLLAWMELCWFGLLDGILVSIVISSAFTIEAAQLARREIRRI